MSFEEKSVWIQLVAQAVVLTGYVLVAGNMLADGIMEIGRYAVPMIGAVIAVIILVVAGHIVAAIQSRPEGRDERDRVIQDRSTALSTHVVAVGALAAMLMLLFGTEAIWVANVLLVSLFLEEIVRHFISIIFYRRGL